MTIEMRLFGDTTEIGDVSVSWARFGLTSLSAVPAWRQSLFAASRLVANNPYAALVLVAAGFEAFFAETMRIRWIEKGLDEAAYKRLNNPAQAISRLVDWLPVVVGAPALRDAPNNLLDRWKRDVNELRNKVVHGGQIHVTTGQAELALRTAFEAIAFLDRFAFTRPHAYYVGPRST